MKIVDINEGVDFRDFSKQVLEAVEQGLDTIALMAQNELSLPTSGWERQVDFKVESKPMERSVYTTDAVYGWVNDGVEGREITPKKPGGRLRFGVPFSPKTPRFGALQPQAGGYESEVIYAKRVQWTGITGRHWDETVATEIEEKGAEIIQTKINQIP